MTPPTGGADIRAVARAAGVSTSTVSRFLNGKKRLSAETEQRIQEVAARLGYAPNRVARSLRLKQTQTIGLLIPDNGNPYFSALVKGAEDAARSSGYAVVLFSSHEDQSHEAAHLRTMAALRCDGALVIVAPDGADEPARRERLGALPFPTVFLDRRAGLPADTVVADNTHGGREATRHLLSLGHRRVGLVTVDYDVSSQRERVDGFVAALAEAGVPRRPELEARVPLGVQDGFSATSRLLTATSPPTALFATSNALAIGAVAAIQAKGLRCPEDVSVVGYDSYDWQDVFAPRLTTISQPAYLMGERAATLLIERLSGKRSGPPEAIVLRPSLVVRDSCRPPSTVASGVARKPR
jgi:DNA-binding LacI/PurR family transcriptional regulator